MQTICTSLQTENHTTPHHSIFRGRMLFPTPNQQCQSTEGTRFSKHKCQIFPILYNRIFRNPQNCPLQMEDTGPIWDMVRWGHQSPKCKRHVNRFIHFCTDSARDWQTDRHTNADRDTFVSIGCKTSQLVLGIVTMTWPENDVELK